MFTTLIENRPVVTVEISGTTLLSNDLTIKLGNVLDQAEDLGSSSVIFIHVVGHTNPVVLPAWPGQIDIQSVTKWERLLRRIERGDSPTIVLAEHACSAIALELLLVADRRLASNDFSVQWVKPGTEMWPSMALYRLVRQIGESRARKLSIETGDISAHRAQELNIVDEIVDHLINGGDPMPQLLGYAPSDGFPLCRRLMEESCSISFDEALGVHLAACERALRRSSPIESSETRDIASAL